MTGQAASPPLVAGRRLIVVTDRGQLEVYDVGVGAEDVPLSLAASREATDAQPVVRYAAVTDRYLWIGDRQLTKHEILPTGNRLPVVSLDTDYSGSTFDRPLQVVGRSLIHVTRSKGKAGYLVAAMDMQAGRVLWETGLADPPAAAPIVDAAGPSLLVASAGGYVFRFDNAALRLRVLDTPLSSIALPAARPLRASLDLGNGRAAYSSAGNDKVLLVDFSQSPQPVALADVARSAGLSAGGASATASWRRSHWGKSFI